MIHEIIRVDESEVCDRWHVKKLSGKLIASSHLEEEMLYDLLRQDEQLSTSKANCVIQACSRIIEARNKKEKVFVGGDYDADGICSTAIMKKTLDVLGITNGYYIPDRFKEGYGLSEKTVELAHQKGYSLIITVDNGVKAHAALQKARQLGMDVIVTDHHQIEEDIEADIVVHPDYMEEQFAYLSGAGVALEISRNLIGTGSQYDALIAMCAVALIGDVMPLWRETRKLVKKGLSIIRQGRVRSLSAMLFPGAVVDETAIAFSIVPKLNAVGRMNDISNVNTLVPYLLSTNDSSIASYCQQLNLVNERRKALSDEESKVAEKSVTDAKIQVIYQERFHEGICGLVAGRLANKYHKPFVVMAKSEGVIKGSGRSVPGFNMFDFFSDFTETCAFGGHEQAVGVSVKEESFDAFLKHIDQKAQIVPIAVHEEKKKAILININDITFENVSDLSTLSPYPKDMIEPLFALKDVTIASMKETPKTIRYQLVGDKTTIDAIVYKRKEIQIPEKQNIFIGKLQINRFRGKISLQMIVEEIAQ